MAVFILEEHHSSETSYAPVQDKYGDGYKVVRLIIL